MEIRPILSAILRNKTAPLLVAIQVAVSLAVLVNAMYVVELRFAAAERPSGIREEENMIYLVIRPLEELSHQQAIAQQLRETAALKAIPGVSSVAWTRQMPMSRSGGSQGVSISRGQQIQTSAASVYYSPDSLIRTFGLNLLEGRDFIEGDVREIDASNNDGVTNYPDKVIITSVLAKTLFPDAASVLGKTMYFGTGETGRPAQIIGIVERLQNHGASNGPDGERSALLPMRSSQGYSTYAIRTEPGQRERVLADAEEVLRKGSPVLADVWSRKVTDDRNARYRNEKAFAWMMVTVSLLLLMVTASGIVGMTALRVAQRRKQVGVRRALGARRRDILRYFVTENLLVTSAGVLAGLVLAMALNQLLASRLGLTKLPPIYLLYGAGAFILLSILAVYGPARRAAAIDPAIATRSA